MFNKKKTKQAEEFPKSLSLPTPEEFSEIDEEKLESEEEEFKDLEIKKEVKEEPKIEKQVEEIKEQQSELKEEVSEQEESGEDLEKAVISAVTNHGNVLQNHEARLREIESALFRLRGAI